MVLLSVADTERAVTFGPMESKGNLPYKFVSAQVNLPMMMQNLEDPVPKVMWTVRALVYVFYIIFTERHRE